MTANDHASPQTVPPNPVRRVPGRHLAPDLLLAGALAAAAVAVRWPYLHLAPRYTDEAKEVMWALRIYWGDHLPLAGHNGYTGPLWSYLLAGLMALFGPSPGLPRAVVMVLGAATVVATYALARAMASGAAELPADGGEQGAARGVGRGGAAGDAAPRNTARADGRVAGVIAGALMVTSFAPVFVSSHVAWSICVTPLLTTLALLAVYVGVRRPSGPLLVAAGLLIGLAMQSHPLGVLLVPAAIVWALLQPAGRRAMRTPWPYAAALATAVAYASMIWFHVSSRFETVHRALAKLSDGVPGAPSVGEYRHNVEALAFNLLDLLTAQTHHSTDLFRADPATFVRGASIVVLLVLAYAAWRSESLPLVVVGSTGLLMPLVNSEYGFPLGSRYLMFLLPVVYSGLALAAVSLLAQLRQRGPTAYGVGSVAVAIATIALVVFPLRPLSRAYQQAEATGQTNALVHEMAALATAEHRGGSTILLSERIDAKFSGGGHIHRVMATLLGLSDVPTVKVHKELKRIDEQLGDCAGDCVLIISARQADELAARYTIAPFELSRDPRPEDGEIFGLFRVGEADSLP